MVPWALACAWLMMTRAIVLAGNGIRGIGVGLWMSWRTEDSLAHGGDV
jgi:hypothetical protein